MRNRRTFFFICAGVFLLPLACQIGARTAGAQGCADTTTAATTTSSTAAAGPTTAGHFKLGLVLTQTDPETVFNVFRVGEYALKQGDDVSLFLLGKAVELEKIKDSKFDVQGKTRAFAAAGGKILACGTCLKIHGSGGSALCPVSSLADLYRIIRSSDRVLTF